MIMAKCGQISKLFEIFIGCYTVFFKAKIISVDPMLTVSITEKSQ